MKLATNSNNKLSDHPNYKRKVPRLDVVNGIARVDANDPVQRKWFENFKK